MRQRGFTLIEVLIALSVLFAALTVFLTASTADVNATNRAKLLTAATGLASGKLLDLEEEIKKNGFSECPDGPQTGDFKDEGFPRYSFEWTCEKVTLPSLAETQSAAAALEKKGSGSGTGSGSENKAYGGLSGSGSGSATGGGNALGAGVLQSQFEAVQNLLEVALRKVTLKVMWKMGSRDEQMTVVLYMTDLKEIDSALSQLGLGGGGGGGGPGGGGGGPGGGSGTGSGPGGGKTGGK